MPRKEDSLENKLSRIFESLTKAFDGYDEDSRTYRDFYVMNTFDDVVVAREGVSGKLFEIPYRQDSDEGEIFFGELKEVAEEYVAKRFEEAGLDFAEKMRRGLELSGPIAWKSDEKRIAYAPVLVPGEEDSDGEIVTKEKIEDSAHEWLESYRNVDYQHRLNNVGVPVESYITPSEMTVKMDLGDGEEDVILPEGTWILASRFGEETWEAVKDRRLNGFSVMGVRRETLDIAQKSDETPATKRTLLADLGPDWVPTHVSIVDSPAVPKARFFALKSKEEEDKKKEDEVVTPSKKEKGIIEKISEILNGSKDSEAVKEGRRFSDNTYQKIIGAFEALSALMEEAEGERAEKEKGEEGEEMKREEVREIVDEAIKEAMKKEEDPAEKNEEEEATGTEEGQEGQTEEQEEQEGTTEETSEFEQFKQEVEEKFEALGVGKSKPESRGLKGQDGEGSEVKKGRSDRDIHGRKIRK